MYDSAKYLIHADFTASGVVERSDVVGAVFGQTEGLLGDELDLRDLQESGKLGRIDVEVSSERGNSFGEITIASGLDRVETAILAASLESIERVGPCRATVEVTELEDVRSAKRREIVERAKELLAEFDRTALTSEELVEEVRRSFRVESITEYSGLPAGPRVADSDAIILVEGRADVLNLLEYGVKNAVAVEGTDVPDAVADLTDDRTVTAFLDGDRGGNLILKELAQVADLDHVAFAPAGQSVEDLSRSEVMSALREKVPYEAVVDGNQVEAGPAATDGSTHPAPPVDPDGPGDTGPDVDGQAAGPDAEAQSSETDAPRTDAKTGAESPPESIDGSASQGAGSGTDDETASQARAGESASNATAEADADGQTGNAAATTLADHVRAVIGESSGRVRLLDGEFAVADETDADGAFEAIESADDPPATVVLDGELSQRLLDVAAQRGVERIVAAAEGEYVKKPTSVRVRTADEF